VAAAEAPAVVPTGFTAWNEHLDYYLTFYWNKRAWALHPGDITKAVRSHWLLYYPIPESYGASSSVPHSVKTPLERTTWYAYPNQVGTRTVGSMIEPARIGRVLDDGTSQIYENTYNAGGHVTSRTDPAGRRTTYVYAANGIDLAEIRQTTGTANDLLTTYSNYTAQHQAQTIVDAAGQTTTMTYNAAGQTLTVTNPRSETTTYSYNTDGYLQTVSGPVSGSAASLTYDAHGRVRTVTDPDGFMVTYDYDIFDRPVKTTYPDGSFDQTVYERLDPVGQRDRLGRWSYTSYDALRRVTATGTRSDARRHNSGVRVAVSISSSTRAVRRLRGSGTSSRASRGKCARMA
jgi:YD repeat-containing protein